MCQEPRSKLCQVVPAGAAGGAEVGVVAGRTTGDVLVVAGNRVGDGLEPAPRQVVGAEEVSLGRRYVLQVTER